MERRHQRRQCFAEWTSEASEGWTDAKPRLISSTQIVPVRGDVYIQASYEVIARTAYFATQVGTLIADAKYVLEQQGVCVSRCG